SCRGHVGSARPVLQLAMLLPGPAVRSRAATAVNRERRVIDVAAALARIDGLRRAGELVQARTIALEAVAASGPAATDRWRLLAALGRVELDAGHAQAAIAAFEEAAAGSPDPGNDPAERAELLLDLGRARRRAGDLDRALEVLE